MTPQEKHQLKTQVNYALARVLGRHPVLFKRTRREIMMVINGEVATAQ